MINNTDKTTKLLAIVEVVLQHVHEDKFDRVPLELGEYTLSILTGSHSDSAELGTIEIGLLKNGVFYKCLDNSDDSIIHYLPFHVFPTFIYFVSLAECSETLEGIFEKYKEMYD
jgi:hypothetical protein